MMAESKMRLTWVDVARGYGILAIMASHIITGYPLSKWLFTFHVPLFFYLSGYLFREGKPFASFCKGKWKKLMIPYFALAGCVVIPETLIEYGTVNFWGNVGRMLLEVLVQRRLWSLWFLPALFLTELTGYWLIRWFPRKGVLALAGLLLAALGIGYASVGGPILPWNLDAVLPMLPFFLAGYLQKNSAWDWGRFAKTKWGVIAFVVLGLGNLAMGAPAVSGKMPGMDVFAASYGFVPLSYPAAFCGIACVILVAHWWQPKPLQYLGKNSMIYFAWHQTPVLSAMVLLFPRMGIPVSGYSSSIQMLAEKLLELTVMLTVLTGCNALLSRSRLKWMLGK